jgi:serine protease Do
VLKLRSYDRDRLPYLRIGNTTGVSRGDEVYTIGSPLGLEGSITKGIVSSRRRIRGVWYIQSDAPINPGNSGGPLLHAGTGQVIGINARKIEGAEGLSFAISTEELKAAFPAIFGQ